MSDAALRLLVFRVGNLVCAAEVDRVREILPRLAPTRVPGAPPAVAGLINVRGTLVTVVDGWRALNQPVPVGNGGASTILLEVSRPGGSGGSGRRVIGLVVDEVMDLLAVGRDALEPRQALPGLDPTLVRAVGRRGGTLFVVLDPDSLLAPMLSA
ncbi:MAG TPA: chemotaxis protein CheW [Gemmatimonadales bacterium]|nr:chemotaxis protein CheW [Gemmatimonadales bacterium]